MYMCSSKLRGRYLFSLPGGPRLKAEDAVLHFMSIIKEPKCCGYVHVCVEYCKLLKNILSVQVYQCDITVKTWQGTSANKYHIHECIISGSLSAGVSFRVRHQSN